ncbi:MAG: glutamine-hydrolyzing carbamoyl-phosphate synthase small subunit [Lachnospiraceae bacterium]|nr:glutamine-hydrolyzing carbamoyl-phosphate synthase small subunit [Lachnospiraceae bacterium]
MNGDNLKRKLVLEDGSVYIGDGFGALTDKAVELVFNTSMVGYQEIVSDPSYTGQAVVMTYPLIGNYGMCDEDYETTRPSISGLIVREYCDEPSNFRCTETLSQVMERYDISGISGIDTRKLARHIRDFGSCKAYITSADTDTAKIVDELKNWTPDKDVVSKVSTPKPYKAGMIETDSSSSKSVHIVAIDCGMKKNILREMAKRGCSITVVPWNTTADDIAKLNPDGVFISNGPGDPQDVTQTIQTVKDLIGKYPIFGICLGHQIISLAYGAMTYKLKFGHRGGNHPVRNLKTDKLEITSQNHSYAVADDSLEGTGLVATHINLLDKTIEGVECVKDKVFSVQYHPESAPGPQDSSYLFDCFLKNIEEFGEEKKHA